MSLAAVGPAVAQGARATVVGSEMNGFGRLIFTLDRVVRAQVRSSNGIVIVSFDQPVTTDLERLATQAPAYVSVARRDPDGRSIRFATTRPFRANMIEAGEKLFLDLLPENWQGLPPGLPQDVVEELARRAREAEERLRRQQRERESQAARPLGIRSGEGPTFRRVVLEPGPRAPIDVQRDGDVLTITVDAPVTADAVRLRAALPAAVTGIEQEKLSGALKLTLTVPSTLELKHFREDDSLVIDFAKARAEIEAEQRTRPQPLPPPRPVAGQPSGPDGEGVPAGLAGPSRAAPPAPVRAVSDQVALRPVLSRSADGVTIDLSFGTPPSAAALLREDVLWLVFDTPQTIEGVPIPEALKADVVRVDVDRAAGAAILRVTLARPAGVAILPTEKGWSAVVGNKVRGASEPLVFRRGVSDDGRTVLATKLPGAGRAFWIDDPDTGDRLGLITAHAPINHLVKPQNFVEVEALATLHGLAVRPKADDVVVRIGLDDVTIGRDRGLTLSLGVADDQTSGGSADQPLLLDVEAWRSAVKGDTRARGTELLRAAAEAPKKDLSEARIRLAQFWLANGFAHEATGALSVVAADDPASVATRPVILMRALAALKAGKIGDAIRLLSDPAIASEPEALLWRAVADARAGRWVPALVNFRQSLGILERYPDDLQARIRPLIVRAALAATDPSLAAQQLDLVERHADRADATELALMRGQLALQMERRDDALTAFDAARKSTQRPVEAEGRLEWTLLALTLGTITAEQAKAELETIAVIWRRDAIEVRALSKLGELYAAEGRWRQAFGAARRATEILPEHPLSRALHDRMAEEFEQLFLAGKADSLPQIEAIGLFYDFRHLTPISRRGDEIIRRLAERLASLDLLDQATELLQHQIDNRISGIARATVASRLAVLYLMNRKPVEALQALRTTRSAELPAELRRGRLLLEARALSELSRTDLAIEVLAEMEGNDAERLRADVFWRGRRWREAGEAFERVLGDAWQGPAALSDNDRGAVMRAGISYVLAGDRLGLDRLRTKFSRKMADSPDARPFQLVTMDSQRRAAEFRELARTVVSGDTLADFLDAYRERYPDAAGPARNPQAAEEAVRAMRERASAAPPAAPPAPG